MYNTTHLDSTIYYQKKAQKFIPKNNTRLPLISNEYLAYTYALKNEFRISESYYNTCIKLLTGQTIQGILQQKDALYTCPDKKNLLITLLDYTDLLYRKYVQTKVKQSLQNSIDLYLLAENLIDIIRINSSELNSKLYWREQANKLYSNAVKTCFALDDNEMAFYFMEQNKAIILMEELGYQNIKSQSKLPQNIRDQEKELRTKIYILNTKIKSHHNIAQLQQELIHTKIRLEKLQDTIHNWVPKPLSKELNLITSLKETQKQCKDNACFLEYMIHDDIGYGLLIEKNKTHFFELQNIKELQKLITQIRHQIAQPFTTKAAFSDFYQTAYKTYNLLVPTKEMQVVIENKTTTIIPDNFLSYLPFEVLINNLENPQYLLEKTEINYALSQSFLRNTPSRENTAPSLVCFAPERFKDNTLTPLSNSIDEVTRIKRDIPSLVYTNKKASKKTFLSELPKHSVIHLATHADAYDSISPWVAFQDEKLTLEELYLTQNNADLVVLSACKTNDGKLANGEGVMSLSRGFFQTGAKSIVASLWNVNDHATAEITTQFYKNLTQKQTTASALRNAKLNYIKKNSLSETSPYYWAPLVTLGQNQVINLPQKSYLWYYLIGLLIVIGVLVYLKKK